MDKYARVQQLFDRFSSSYDGHMLATNHVAVQQRILEKFLPFVGCRVCDIACGTGATARLLLALNHAYMTCIDFSPLMLEHARHSFPPGDHVRFLAMDVHELDSIREKYDTITCCYGFYWFREPRVVVRNIKNLLRQGGSAIVLEERFFREETPQPLFAAQGGCLAELAGLENYLGVMNVVRLFEEERFVVRAQYEQSIDGSHALCGTVFSIPKSAGAGA